MSGRSVPTINFYLDKFFVKHIDSILLLLNHINGSQSDTKSALISVIWNGSDISSWIAVVGLHKFSVIKSRVNKTDARVPVRGMMS